MTLCKALTEKVSAFFCKSDLGTTWLKSDIGILPANLLCDVLNEKAA